MKRIRELVDQWGIQVVLYATMWLGLMLMFLASLLVLGPQSCVDPVRTYDPRFDQPPRVE